jgi:UDP-2-acetamido-2,6-beta-L-arabino-hexul-4-ose reductase
MTGKSDSNSAPQKIVVTGSDGLLGWHMRVFLSTCENVDVVPCNRETFNDDESLANCLEGADAVIHLAGMNRGDELEVAAANVAIAQRLVQSCRTNSVSPHIVYSSSTHIDGDSRYGQSKKQAGEIIETWAAESGAGFCDLVLPHIYGEHGKPFYNSACSTFAHQIAQGEQPSVTGNGQLNLLHTQQAARIIWRVIQEGTSGQLRPQGESISVLELVDRLSRLADRYRSGVVPPFVDPFDLRLFNTWRSYLTPAQRPIDFALHSDDRGSLFETLRSDGQGQVFVSTTHPGITRGNHFHFDKVERFAVISGKATIRLRRVLFDHVEEYEVSGDKPQAIDMPTLYTHNITNTGDEPLVTLFWAAQHFDPDHPDTFFLPVEQSVDSRA